jgi:hypothetical protein
MKVMLLVFFWHWGCCASWILTLWANSESPVLSQSAETFKRKCQEQQLLVPPLWQCASSCITNDLWLSGQHKHKCASSATLLTWPGSGRLFLFPKLKSTLKGWWFQMIQEITENSQT